MFAFLVMISGKVRNSRTCWGDNGKADLDQLYTIEVDESIKDQSPRSLEVTTSGGKMGDVELHVSGPPSQSNGMA